MSAVTAPTAVEFERAVEFLQDNAQEDLTAYSRTLLRNDETGREVVVPAAAVADNFKGRLVCRMFDQTTRSWNVITSTGSARAAALFYFG